MMKSKPCRRNPWKRGGAEVSLHDRSDAEGGRADLHVLGPAHRPLHILIIVKK